MTFLQQIQAHTGGLVRLKTELYWYGSGYDKNPDRICLILDASTAAAGPNAAVTTTAIRTTTATRTTTAVRSGTALLLIDGSPQRIWIAEQDVEIMLEDPSTHTHACMQEVSNEQKRQHSLGSSRASAD